MATIPDKETLLKFLANVSLFSKADSKALLHLAEKIVFETFPQNKTVIRKGDMGETMYLIFSGNLKVHDGEHIVARLKDGHFFGELSLLDSEPRSMSVTALDESVLGSICRNDFYEVLQSFPAMTKDIIAVLNNRLRGQNDVLIKEFKTREAQLTELVKIRTNELEQKNAELEEAMANLKKSQQQLIQSEKLASLGQLTAGIAHEIKNPLNFVNNFSILSTELVKELRQPNTAETENEILTDLEGNLTRITEHGKRADSIVKNMLDHSRTGTGEKQPTDINKLCDEFLNLAFYGVRANHPEFNSEMKRNFQAGLPQINIKPHDISRVLINMFNNSFYALMEKEKECIAAGVAFVPQVSLTTSMNDKHIFISVRDNGKGIPDKIKEKIFQPFFTTKPTGQGTGLGLSLSFDIIHSHGGEISINSKENEFTEFIVKLPL
jgi:signal transduction histidine kinase